MRALLAGLLWLVAVSAAAQTLTSSFGSAAYQNTGTSGANLCLLNGTCTWSGANTISTNGAASTPAMSLTGTLFGNSGTNSVPLLYYNCPTSTAPTTWSTVGTVFGANTCSGAVGNYIDMHANGLSVFKVGSAGGITGVGGMTITGGATSINKNSNNTVEIGDGSTTSTVTIGGGSNGVIINSNSAGSITDTGFISGGTKFTTSGCSVSSTTGGATAGVFTVGANNCTVVVTMNGATGLTAPNGWTCQAHDRTTVADLIAGESSSTTTTASIVIPVTAGATDVISFSCVGF